MDLRLRFELRGDQFKNLKCSPLEQQLALSGCQTGFPTISPVPQYAIRTGGVVGRRLHLNVDFDSQREFDANNNLQVWYEGLEDEALRRVEVGNVTFQMPPSRFISAGVPANNFGVQASGRARSCGKSCRRAKTTTWMGAARGSPSRAASTRTTTSPCPTFPPGRSGAVPDSAA